MEENKKVELEEEELSDVNGGISPVIIIEEVVDWAIKKIKNEVSDTKKK